MFFHIKKIAGPFFPFLVYLLASFTLLFFSRMGLSLWQFDRVSAASGWLNIMLQGLRVDMATIVIQVGVIALFSAYLSGPHVIGRAWNKAAQAWLSFSLMLLALLTLTVGFLGGGHLWGAAL